MGKGALMRTYVLKQLGYGMISLFLLSVTIFVVIRATGDPALMIVGPGAQKDDLDRARVEWGLDQSYPQQYLNFVGRLAAGDTTSFAEAS